MSKQEDMDVAIKKLRQRSIIEAVIVVLVAVLSSAVTRLDVSLIIFVLSVAGICLWLNYARFRSAVALQKCTEDINKTTQDTDEPTALE